MKKWFIITFIIIVIAGGAFYLHLQHKPKPVVATISVKVGNLTETSEAVGYIEPVHAITVKSQIDGTVAKLYHDEGDYVKKGEPLVEIKPAPEPAIYAQTYEAFKEATAVELSAQKDFDRYEEALKKGLITKNYTAYIEAKRTLDTAKLQRILADQRLALLDKGHTQVGGKVLANLVKSPVDGYILVRGVDVGDPVLSLSSPQASTTLFSMANMQDLMFQGTVDEIDASKIKEGMPAQITVGASPDKPIEGMLSKIALQAESADESTALASPFNVGFKVQITQLKIPKDLKLRSGYSATAIINIRTLKNILLLPATAVNFRDGNPYVLLPDPVKPKEQAIKVGASDGMNIQIIEGLKEGEKVVQEQAPKDED
ncbi:MAG: efflux RND transporter periplasmic adaptor subunit [Gammaproteobacteria bacterium]|nr:efflux RND transporter periplasmic adaptor subunit [Gammaproteobacteria bacterium]